MVNPIKWNTPVGWTMLLLMVASLVIRCVGIGAVDLLAEEAYYWNYAQHLDWSYLDHPPMVALLIRGSTAIFGVTEWAVRMPSLMCWLGGAWFSFKLTEQITRYSGWYAVFLLSILPFFTLQSMVMTPDEPLFLCWSAALYSLYQALVLHKSNAWFTAGLWLGLGMLSKYTIVLVGLSALVYVSLVPEARYWFRRWPPYVAVLMAMIVFLPVVYWNAQHDWVSFTFQSARRIHEAPVFSLYAWFGLLILFITPMGLWPLCALLKPTRKADARYVLNDETKRFLQCFTMVPLCFFGVFSMTHAIKFNWIGTGLLAFIPWMVYWINRQTTRWFGIHRWMGLGTVLLVCYAALLGCMLSGTPQWVQLHVLSKYISWADFTRQVHHIAQDTSMKQNRSLVIIPLDKYNLASELAFYQAKMLAQGEIAVAYPVVGSHVVGGESLMYRYWSNSDDLSGKLRLFLAEDPRLFDNSRIQKERIPITTISSFWAKGQGAYHLIRKYYGIVDIG